MATRKYVGRVRTNNIGSECEFEFEVDDEDLPEDPDERAGTLNEIALEALWESGKVEWSYKEATDDPEE